MNKTLLAVDGMAYIFRAYYAVPYMCNHDRIPTNAVYGFHKLLQTMLHEVEPDYLAVAFDLQEPTFRKEAYSDYKANRPAPPDDLLEQIPIVREYLGAMGIPIVECPGYEADDCLATLAVLAKGRGIKTLIATGDKDLCQMVDDDIFILRSSMRDMKILDAGGVKREYGVWPSQIVDYLTIVGDSSDNVPGVKGIGVKGARELLNAYESLDKIYASLDELPKGQKQKLTEAADHIEDSRFLIRICSEVPLKCELSNLERAEASGEAVNCFCAKYDFQSIGGRGSAAPKNEEPQQQELF